MAQAWSWWGSEFPEPRTRRFVLAGTQLGNGEIGNGLHYGPNDSQVGGTVDPKRHSKRRKPVFAVGVCLPWTHRPAEKFLTSAR